MEIDLDRPERFSALDRESMLDILRLFPESCLKAIEAVVAFPDDALPHKDFSEIVISGVGGSAIGGHLLSDWLLDDCPVPIHVSRGYELPRFVGADSLVFAISYSGNTEETISAFKAAISRGCSIITITLGGLLEKLSADEGIPVLSLPKGVRPRASLPSQFFTLVTALKKIGFLKGIWDEVDEALHILDEIKKDLLPETTTASNPAKQIALGLRGMVPFVFGPRLFEGVAYRIRSQLNENSKIMASSGFFPEAFHNSVMGCEGPEEVRRHVCILIIDDPGQNAVMKRKIGAFKRLMEPKVGCVMEISTRGCGKLARMMSALYIGDYASTYLGLLNNVDPSSTGSIETLKRC